MKWLLFTNSAARYCRRVTRREVLGWMTGFEPATSGSTIRRSNQLSYTHHGRKEGTTYLLAEV